VAKKGLLSKPGREASVLAVSAAQLLRYKVNPKVRQHFAINMGNACTNRLGENLGNAQKVCDKVYVIQHMVEA
jgi:hypothetical protein